MQIFRLLQPANNIFNFMHSFIAGLAMTKTPRLRKLYSHCGNRSLRSDENSEETYLVR